MRISGGIYKGRGVNLSKKLKTRPTSGLVREAFFSIVGNEIKGNFFLDLFGGSGMMAFEAISREAECAVYCDVDKKLVKNFYVHCEKMGFDEKKRLIFSLPYHRVLLVLSNKGFQFSHIYCDPPYTYWEKPSFAGGLLKTVHSKNLLDAGGALVFEIPTEAKATLLRVIEKSVFAVKAYKYGKTSLLFLRLAS